MHMKHFKMLRRILSHLKDSLSDGDKSSVVYKINVMTVMPAILGGH